MNENEIVREKVEIEVADGTRMGAYTTRPKGPSAQPGLMVFQEAFGVNSHIRDVADRFAAQGYCAIAPELFHRTAPQGFEGDYKDFDSVKPHYQAVTNEGAELDIRATYDWLSSQPSVRADRISCVGFCMGGRISFLANSVIPMRAAVSYYGGGIAPGLLDRASRLHSPALLIWGGRDKHITREHRNAVIDALETERKTYVNAVFWTAEHAFFCNERSAYNPDAASQSWALTLEFLRT